MVRSTLVPHGFVARDSEVGVLQTALEAAAAGTGSTVLIAGEAGIGKTRLLSEFAERARAQGACVLMGHCIDLVGAGLPYVAFIEAFREVEADASGTVLARLIAEPTAPGGPTPGRALGSEGQLWLFEEVRQSLERLAASTPVVLMIEDLHWADVSTLDLVAFLARAVARCRIVVVTTYRSDEAAVTDPVHRFATRLARDCTARVLTLEPLSLSDLTDLLDASSESAVPAELARAIFDRCDGNPFFALELLAANMRGERQLPAVLRDTLLQRVAGLSEDARAVLAVAAAARRDVPYRLLAAATTLTPARLRDALLQAVQQHVLVPEPERGTFRFRHGLLAEAVYADLIPGQREELHARLAQTLTDHPALGVVGGLAGEIAHHWAAAGLPANSIVASLQAAAEAESAYGLAESLRHLEHVLALWQDVPDAQDLTGEGLPRVLARAAELADLTGDGPRAAELVRRAIALTRSSGDRAAVGMLHERLGSYLIPTGDRRAGLAACRRAVRLVPAVPPSAQRARVLTTLANALMLSWRHAESRDVCVEALAAARACGDDRPALRARGILGINLCYLGRPDEGLVQLRAALDSARERGGPRDVAHGYAMLCDVLIASGRIREATEVALDGIATAHTLGVEHSFGALLSAYAAEAMLETGDWDRADELLGRALRPGATFWAHFPHLLRAQLSLCRGELDAARRHLEAGSRAAHEPTSAARYARVAAEVFLADGRLEAAAQAVSDWLDNPAVARAAAQRVRLAALGVRVEADRAELDVAAGGDTAAEPPRRRGRRLLALARSSIALASAVTAEAAAWLATADAEFSRVERRPCPERWQSAVIEWRRLDRPHTLAYCLWRYAEAALGADRAATDAAAAARESRQIASRLDARPMVREIELLALRARLDLSEPIPRPHDGTLGPSKTLGLTRREVEVLHLVANGYTNRQIASHFTISVKTASVHVSNILRKLGAANRVQAGAIAHRLLRPPASTG